MPVAVRTDVYFVCRSHKWYLLTVRAGGAPLAARLLAQTEVAFFHYNYYHY
ncbi:hypothetical protein D3C73_1658710 [compost metagenome]